MSMIIGRRQIILAALVLALGTAIFLNWKFSSTNGGFNIASVFNSTSTLGDASYVDNQNVSGASTDNYFAQARLTREQNRAKAEDVVKALTASTNISATDKQAALTAIEDLAKNISNEGNIESLVKAKGFADCVAFINEGAVNIVVKPKTGDALSPSEAAQVKDIVMSQAKVSADKITIIASKIASK